MILKKRKYRTFDMFLLMYRITPVYSTIVLLEKLIATIMPAVTIYVTANFVDSAKAILTEGMRESAIIMPIVLLVGIALFWSIEGYFMGFVQVRMEIKSRVKIKAEILERRARLEYKYIESQEKLDLINRVCGGIDDGMRQQFNRLLDLASLIGQIISIMTVLILYVYWAAIVLIVICVPLFILAGKSGKKSYDANKEVTKISRKAGYLSGLLKSRDSIEERYIYGYAKTINDRYMMEFEKARVFKKNVEKKNYIRMKLGSVIFAVITMIIAGVLLIPTISGTISIGIFISLVQALDTLVGKMSWNLPRLTKDLIYYRQYLKDLEEFMDLDSVDESNILTPSSPPVPFQSLEFCDVSFRYPGTESYILKNMSFKIEAGRHYSVVGVNGAGKTTITKLITGLYKDFEGEILVNGKSIREYTQAELKSLCTVVYQDFARYYITIGENIAIGNINDIDTASSKASIERASKLLKLDDTIGKLKKGLDTPLGKIKEDGVDLSGGEWQRVALARTVVNPAPLRILDEPTAALDPISESTVYKQFEKISRADESTTNRTTIFISHRLGSTKLADEIIVIGDGRVLEQGSHQELMQKKGLYSEMYKTQADWYISDTAVNGEVLENAG